MPHKYSPSTQHLKLGDEFFDPVTAADFPKTILRYRNQKAAETVGLANLTDIEWLKHFGRFNPLPENLSQPLALRYHGHQFRNYNPELGDGRGFLFAQLFDDAGRLLDLGTKGSGQTPWSRAGDGRLTLKGGVREVLATELLTALGVNTSKSFSLIETGERLYRNDEPSPARSSVLVRLNHSHIRIGTFQRLLYLEDHSSIEKLVGYSIENYWPNAKNSESPALEFYKHVVKAVAKMGAQWFVAGFVHGVLNTDNITITGESFDYGPWRFLPNLDPDFTAAYFDHSGLYAFGRQPDALQWNLARLAECLIPLCNIDELKSVLESYSAKFEAELQKLTLKRLGLIPIGDEPDPLIPLFYKTLRDTDALYEQTFFDFAGGAVEERLTNSPNAEHYKSSDMSVLITHIRKCETVSGANAFLDSELTKPSSKAPTLLIDEVEEIWSQIADKDDWSVFEAKISEIRKYGALNLQLWS